MSDKLKTQELFGQSRSLPLNYVERDTVDGLFRDSLAFNKQIVVHGNSKQGKTCLIKHNLRPVDYLIVNCSNKWDIGRLNAQILKQSGFDLKTSTYKTIDGKTKVIAAYKSFKQVEPGSDSTGIKEVFNSLELDPYDPNDIIKALNLIEFKKYIVLEDFHYLPEETKKDFSIGLKNFHENSGFSFIITGVWEEQNKLEEFNQDLSGRVFSICTDNWEQSDLEYVIERGERLLNINIPDTLKEDILNWSNNNVFELQELCLKICVENGIMEQQDIRTKLSDNVGIFELKTNNWKSHA